MAASTRPSDSTSKPSDSTAEPLCCSSITIAPLDDADAARLAAVLKALADPVRLKLVSIVASAADGEACACDFAEPLGKSQPTISHHLSQLVKAGILEREQRGKWAWFRLNDERLADLCRALGSAPC